MALEEFPNSSKNLFGKGFESRIKTRPLNNPTMVPQCEQPPQDTQFLAAQLRDLANEAVSLQCSGSLQLANSSVEVPPLSPAGGLHVISSHATSGVEPFTKQSPRPQIQDGSSAQQQQLEPSPSLACQSNEALLQGAMPQGDFHLALLPEKLRCRILKM